MIDPKSHSNPSGHRAPAAPPAFAALNRQSMLLADYWRISRRAKQAKPDQLAAEIARAEDRFRDRLSRSPAIAYAEGLPVSERADEIASLRIAARDFPGDRGLFVALLMNLVVLHRGEALFAPAGVLHAYQSGLGVELMAASDNVLRGGLTPKHVDVPELLRVLDPSVGPAPLVAPQPLADGVAKSSTGGANSATPSSWAERPSRLTCAARPSPWRPGER